MQWRGRFLASSAISLSLSAMILEKLTLLMVPIVSFLFGTALGPVEMAALQQLLWILAGAWLGCFVLGELTGNVSQVDKVWSILPVVYTWTVALHGDFTPRLVLMAVLVTAWGARLTYNFSRHGAYRLKFWSGHEDYRWQVLRNKPEFEPRWKWTLFNLGFISGYQNVLIMLMTLPTIVVLQFAEIPLGPMDFAVAALAVFMTLPHPPGVIPPGPQVQSSCFLHVRSAPARTER